MTGTKLTLDTIFTNNSLPRLTADPILAAGSMFLMEPGHPANPWTGVPASGAIVPNLASEQMIKRGLDPALTFRRDADAFVPGKGILERTSKGGLHAITSEATPMAENLGAYVAFPDWVPKYLVDNKSHDFYWSLWLRRTRLYTGPNAYVYSHLANNASGNGLGYIGDFSSGTALSAVLKTKAGKPGADTTEAELEAEELRHLATFGRATHANRNRIPPSYVLYRAYLEDLTVSGRTEAEAAAADQAEYAAQVTATTGRYYGDTFTSPSTLP